MAELICALTQDYSFGCDTGAGGVAKEAYIIEEDNVDSVTESSGTITAITKAPGKIFRKYQLVQETALAEETMTGNVQNGTLFYAQKFNIVLNRQQVAVRNEILLLAKARIAVVVQDNNGEWRYFGRDQGLKLSTGVATTGTAWGDRNEYTLEFTGNERELAPFVLPEVIPTLQAA